MSHDKSFSFFRQFVIASALGVAAFASWKLITQSSSKKESVRPGINSAFYNAALPVSESLGKLEVESREVFVRRSDIVKAIGLHSQQVVCDLGAGTGVFMHELAQTAQQVWMLDPAEKFQPFLAERVQQLPQEVQHKVHIARSTDFDLGSEVTQLVATQSLKFHAVLIIDTYHHFEYPQDMMKSIHASLAEGASVYILDFEKIPGKSSSWVMGHVRADKQTVIEEWKQSGLFKFKQEYTQQLNLQENYLIEFIKA